jgi:hypothetical protein
MAQEYDPYAAYGIEDTQKVGLLTSGVAGIASGLIKIPKGVFSLAAELIDLGFDTNSAASVEQAFEFFLQHFQHCPKQTATEYIDRFSLLAISSDMPL